MTPQQRQQRIVALRDSLENLRRVVEECAATTVRLSAALDALELDEELETETPLSDQPIVLVDDDTTTIVIQTVHGVRDIIRIPRNGDHL